jgi:hypothetical protein
MKDLIVSIGVNGREPYADLIKGLEKSIVDANWRGDVRIYKEWPRWAIPHSSIPYAFKYDIIKRALWDGYTHVYWLDSVMRLVAGKDISDLLFQSRDGFVAFHNEGHDLKDYINDTALNRYKVENVDRVPQCWGGALFFDFGNPTAVDFFNQILHARRYFKEDGTQRPGFKGHRHDQALISLLMWQNGFSMLPYGIIAAPKDANENTFILYGD